MENIQKHLDFSLGLLMPCFVTVCLALHTTNITTDQSALLALKAHITNEPHQILQKSWSLNSPVCEWIGVVCGSRHHRVTALNVSGMDLSGTVPPQLGNLSFLVSLDLSENSFHGELPPEFARLRRLRVLKLGVNNLTGDFPPWIGAMHELEYLSLRNNSFTGLILPSISNVSKLAWFSLSFNSVQGNIPIELFNISSLEMVSLASNMLSGLLPDNICQNLQRLSWLSFSRNDLNGQIPSSIGQCLALRELYLSGNKFTGAIPKEIGSLMELNVLALGDNQLEGSIPKTIDNLTMLSILDIGFNNIEGQIPRGIGNLTMLTLLYLRYTNITGVIPQEIKNLQSMNDIDLGWNRLTGFVPIEIFNISTITSIALGGNQLSGNLPSTMGYWLPNLGELFLNRNNFGGTVPDSISNCSMLYMVELSFNSFTGPIPNFLGRLTQLKVLNLLNNNLTGDPSSTQLSFIYSLANCKDLKRLGLDYNPLNGILPDSIGNLSTSLEMLFLKNCNIRGTVPSGIGNLSSLVGLNLANNQLTGSFPNRIKDLQKLQAIDLSRNRVNISLQSFCASHNLAALVVEENNIFGAIPECLGNITSMRYLHLGSNELNSSLPKSIWNLKDLLELDLSSNLLSGSLPPEINNLKMATTMDFSMNQFSGGIPFTIGDMENLNYLLLDHNRLEGSIPESIGKMLSLESLDLSGNSFSGSLPKSLEALQHLMFFNVSFNKLSGEIPSGGSFTNFTAESFISNEALCGAERFHVPPCPSISVHKRTAKNVGRVIFVLLGIIIVAGVTSVAVGYLRCRRKGKAPSDLADLSLATQERISYFKLVRATDGYNESNLLGTGSFGSVFKGTLDDGRVVAVKVFNLQLEGSFKSFDVECEVLRKLRHRNLAKVISSVSNPEFKALILEYMPNGSIEKWLYSPNYCLNITQRLNILIDVACALQYLHCENSTPVVHCDLKPGNVLLDQAMVAHVSDFGISKLLGHEDSVTYTKTLATLCYLAPEYGLDGLVSTKCDVYSFGIMMMEIFTGKSPNDEMFGENLSLKSWVNDSVPNGLVHVIDADLLQETEEKYRLEIISCISWIMEVALNCTKESPRERSSVHDVHATLNKIKHQLLPLVEGH